MMDKYARHMMYRPRIYKGKYTHFRIQFISLLMCRWIRIMARP